MPLPDEYFYMKKTVTGACFLGSSCMPGSSRQIKYARPDPAIRFIMADSAYEAIMEAVYEEVFAAWRTLLKSA